MFDPSCAHVTIGNKRYQVLKPEQFEDFVMGQDDDGNDIVEKVPLPREWDEEATMALVNRDHPPAKPQEPEEPTFQDVSS